MARDDFDALGEVLLKGFDLRVLAGRLSADDCPWLGGYFGACGGNGENRISSNPSEAIGSAYRGRTL